MHIGSHLSESLHARKYAQCRFVDLDLASDEARGVLGGVDIAFAFSTCFDDEFFATALRRALPLGAIVVTVDATLPNRELGSPGDEKGGDGGDGPTLGDRSRGSESGAPGFFLLHQKDLVLSFFFFSIPLHHGSDFRTIVQFRHFFGVRFFCFFQHAGGFDVFVQKFNQARTVQHLNFQRRPIGLHQLTKLYHEPFHVFHQMSGVGCLCGKQVHNENQ